MIIIFGSRGYVGSAIGTECGSRGLDWREGKRGATPDVLNQIQNVDLAINCAAYIPSPTVDACKLNKDETILGNVIWPYTLSEACQWADVPLIHLSTACLFDEQREYSETDSPTRDWNGYCGEYVGGKLLAEKLVSKNPKHYILRLRLPFDEVDHPRNYLSKLAKFDRVYEHLNSLTHRGDFAKWALDLWEQRGEFGTYHCVNQGQISAYDLVMAMSLRGMMAKVPEFVKSPGTTGARLSVDKLLNAGVDVRPVSEAVMESLKNWKTTCIKP